MIAHFDELNGFSDGFCLDLEQLPATFGRAADVTVQVTNLLVSRYHCEIAVKNNQLVIRDLGSVNGTLLNGDRVDEAPLFSGDTLQIGLQSFLVRGIQNSMLDQHRRKTVEDSVAAVAV